MKFDHERIWYGDSPLSAVLAPLGWLYWVIVMLRRATYKIGLMRSQRLPVPVIVVGNIAVGGTGKTPLVIWLARHLRAAGWVPGIVSRGYGGDGATTAVTVTPDSDPALVGDEPVLMARRAECPVSVCVQRVAAGQALVSQQGCDIIISDDGLQHYALARDVEIAVVDGVRRHGNGRCLPAGPLREPVRRLRSVDVVAINGAAREGECGFQLEGSRAQNLAHPDRVRDLAVFAGSPVHAVAGIGNPARFFDHLRVQGLEVIEHPFPDHHAFRREDLRFDDEWPVLMTEKDAVKCRRYARPHWWSVAVEARLSPLFDERLAAVLSRITAEDKQKTGSD